MKEIIKEIYRGNIDEIELAKMPTDIDDEKEFRIYEELYKTLTQKQKSLFDKFIELLSLNQCKFTENKYIRGFKTGLIIGIECANFKL